MACVGATNANSGITSLLKPDLRRQRVYPIRSLSSCVSYTSPMTGKKQFERQIADLDALREAPPKSQPEALRKGLANKGNFIAAKAADLIREFNLHELTPDLLKAFDRFFGHPEKSDPQCWAKNAISRALAAFELQDADVLLRGMRHIQMEPVWGGQSDTAGTLRATCALALVQCRQLSEPDLLGYLVDPRGQRKGGANRSNSGHRSGRSPSAALLLRLQAVLGNDEPEVLGACYSGVLHIEGITAIPWITGFLATADDAAGEAALAIAATRSPEGFETLRENLGRASDPWFRSVLLSAIALTRQDAAIDFLLDLVRTETLDAEGAIEALSRSAPSEDLIERLQEDINKSPTGAVPRRASTTLSSK